MNRTRPTGRARSTGRPGTTSRAGPSSALRARAKVCAETWRLHRRQRAFLHVGRHAISPVVTSIESPPSSGHGSSRNDQPTPSWLVCDLPSETSPVGAAGCSPSGSCRVRLATSGPPIPVQGFWSGRDPWGGNPGGLLLSEARLAGLLDRAPEARRPAVVAVPGQPLGVAGGPTEGRVGKTGHGGLTERLRPSTGSVGAQTVASPGARRATAPVAHPGIVCSRSAVRG